MENKDENPDGPFCGDVYFRSELEKLIKEYGIKMVVETGTYLGITTAALAEMAESVLTVEINPEYYNKNKVRFLTIKNITAILAKSADVLRGIDPCRTLVFLDAHWGDRSPLLEELSAIAAWHEKPIIVIHDFKVPGIPEFGYDRYDGRDYDMDLIADSICKIYGCDGFTYYYNTKATGHKRGVIYIKPKL
jgi:predicted O-methyltransferase YrrM